MAVTPPCCCSWSKVIEVGIAFWRMFEVSSSPAPGSTFYRKKIMIYFGKKYFLHGNYLDFLMNFTQTLTLRAGDPIILVLSFFYGLSDYLIQ